MSEDVVGLDELLKKMDNLPLVLQKTLIVRSLRKGAEPIRARAEELAPDDPTTPGSRIKEGMMVTVTDQTADGAIAKIGPSRKAFFGQFEEYGTSRQAAEPFLRPAFDEQQDEAIRVLGEDLAEGIEREMSKR